MVCHGKRNSTLSGLFPFGVQNYVVALISDSWPWFSSYFDCKNNIELVMILASETEIWFKNIKPLLHIFWLSWLWV